MCFSVCLPHRVCVFVSAVMEGMKDALSHSLPEPRMQIRQAKPLPIDLEHGHHPDTVQTWATCAEEVMHHLASSDSAKRRIRLNYYNDVDENVRLCFPPLTCISKVCIPTIFLFRSRLVMGTYCNALRLRRHVRTT